MLGLRKETTKDIINSDNLKKIAASVENLGTGKMNVHKGIQVIITTRVTTIITTRATTITKIKGNSMDTLLGSCWTLVYLATFWMKNLWKNVNSQYRNHHLQQLNWLMD